MMSQYAFLKYYRRSDAMIVKYIIFTSSQLLLLLFINKSILIGWMCFLDSKSFLVKTDDDKHKRFQ